jgi:hypothetical protein
LKSRAWVSMAWKLEMVFCWAGWAICVCTMILHSWGLAGRDNWGDVCEEYWAGISRRQRRWRLGNIFQDEQKFVGLRWRFSASRFLLTWGRAGFFVSSSVNCLYTEIACAILMTVHQILAWGLRLTIRGFQSYWVLSTVWRDL